MAPKIAAVFQRMSRTRTPLKNETSIASMVRTSKVKATKPVVSLRDRNFGEVALPRFGNFEILAKAADLVALQTHVEAVVGLANGEVAQLIAKGVVDAVGPLLSLRLYEFERGEVAAKLSGEKGLGQAAGFGFFEASRRVLLPR